MNTRKVRRCAKASLRMRVLAFLLSVMFSIQITVQFAQSGGPGEGQGRNSHPGELQSDPLPETLPGSGSMGEPDPQEGIGGATMNEKPRRGRGKSMPPVDAIDRQAPGGQSELLPEAPPEGSHLHLRLLITAEGEAKILWATEVPGDVALSDDTAGDLVYEVARGDELLAVQALPDPFEQRSIPLPGSEIAEHHSGRATSAAIVVKVPRSSLEDPGLDSLSLRLYEMGPGEAVERLDGETLDRLRREGRLRLKLELAGDVLSAQIRKRGRRLAR